jgi:hypothetical protein
LPPAQAQPVTVRLADLTKIVADEVAITRDAAGAITHVATLPANQQGSYRLGSATDPDATYRVHGPAKCELGYNVNLAVDRHFVREIQAATGAQPDAAGLPDLLTAQQEHHGVTPAQFIYDAAAGEAKTRVLVTQATAGQTQLIAPLRPATTRHDLGPADCTLAADGLSLTCPHGQVSTTAYRAQGADGRTFRFTAAQCQDCPRWQACRGPKTPAAAPTSAPAGVPVSAGPAGAATSVVPAVAAANAAPAGVPVSAGPAVAATNATPASAAASVVPAPAAANADPAVTAASAAPAGVPVSAGPAVTATSVVPAVAAANAAPAGVPVSAVPAVAATNAAPASVAASAVPAGVPVSAVPAGVPISVVPAPAAANADPAGAAVSADPAVVPVSAVPAVAAPSAVPAVAAPSAPAVAPASAPAAKPAKPAMRQFFISDYRDVLAQVRTFNATPEYKAAMKLRPGVERVIAGLTRYNGARRCQRRGLANADYQAKMNGMAFNLKTWLRLRAERDRASQPAPA